MADRRWRGRDLLAVAKSPERIEHGIVERGARQVRLRLQDLFELIRLIFVFESGVLKHGQAYLVMLVGDHLVLAFGEDVL